MKKLVVSISLIVSIISGCDKSDPIAPAPLPPPPEMTGTWSGGTVFLLRINVLEEEATIRGTGMFNGNLGMFINGKSSYPDVSFTIESQGFIPATFTGTYVHKDTIDGTLNGSGFSDVRMILGRFQ